MSEQTQATENTQDITAGDDDFMAELEAELNSATDVETPDVEELSGDEVVAADADDTDAENFSEPEQKPAKQAKKGKGKSSAKDKDADGVDAKDSDTDAAKPKRQSLSGMPPSAALHTALGDKVYDHCVVNPKMAKMKDEARKTAINEFLANDVDTLAKKVKEKAINTFLAVAGHATLSVYTETALKLLKDKGEFTGVDLKNVYLKRPYSPGTSSAQSSQMMQLLPALQIAERKGNTLVLNEDSPLFELLTD